MKRHRHTPEQVVRKLAEGERILNGGGDLAAVLRTLEISGATWNRSRSQYGGMKASEAKRLKELEAENARLKKLVANQAMSGRSWDTRCGRCRASFSHLYAKGGLADLGLLTVTPASS